MKLVHLATSNSGGAARAAARIHRSMESMGVQSDFLVSRDTGSEQASSLANSRLDATWRHLKLYQNFRLQRKQVLSDRGLFTPFTPSYGGTWKNSAVLEADILTLYWVAGFIGPKDFQRFQKPVVWRLSDMWPFTGGCHYAGDCLGFEKKCGQCPLLRTPSSNDLSTKALHKKLQAYRECDLTIVAPSHWIADLAKRSALFRNCPIEVIPTGVDTDIFRPLPKDNCRKEWGVMEKEFVLVAGASSFTEDPRKGYRHLQRLIRCLKNMAPDLPLRLVLFGNNNPIPPSDFPVPVTALGTITCDTLLNKALCTGDILCILSQEDNLPQVALEGIASGVPVAGFSTGGLPDAVQEGRNGVLSPTGDILSLARKIVGLQQNIDRLPQFARASRQLAEDTFSVKTQAASFFRLYQNLYNRGRHDG